MKELLEWLGVRDNVTFAIAVAGFLMSTWTAISGFIRSRECYDLEVIDYSSPRPNVIQFLVCIRNSSSSPLTIVDFSAFGTTCELREKMIRGKPGAFGFQHTPQFPLCLPAHGAQYAYLEFVGEDLPVAGLYPGRKVQLEIRSTRKVEHREIMLSDISHYLHTRDQ